MTVRFTMAGVTSFRCAFGMCLALAVPMTVRTMTILWTVCERKLLRMRESFSTYRITRTTPWTVRTAPEVCENRVATARLQIKIFSKPYSRLEALLRNWGPLSRPISGFRAPPGDFKFCLKAQRLRLTATRVGLKRRAPGPVGVV